MKRIVVEAVERTIGRRSFVRKTALMSGAFLTGLLGAPKKAAAGTLECCGLCHTPGNPAWPSNCLCTWCWVCKNEVHCVKWKCKECIQSFPGSCTQSLCACHNTDVYDACRTCSGVVASEKTFLGKYTPCTPP